MEQFANGTTKLWSTVKPRQNPCTDHGPGDSPTCTCQPVMLDSWKRNSYNNSVHDVHISTNVQCVPISDGHHYLRTILIINCRVIMVMFCIYLL